ncbi:MAG TPA: S8 family serine peptidase [Tepidisphaeraceae bacterium]|jgi:hypothetical protein
MRIARPIHLLEPLEERQLMALTWGEWPKLVGMDQVFAQYPWLDGGGYSVAVVDKGIDFLHPRLGGDPATGTVSPRVVNIWDWEDNDNYPFPDTSEKVDVSTAHATGVAGILAMLPWTNPVDGKHYQGILQNPDSLLYNLRTSSTNSQNTIRDALQWVVDNHAKYHITAVNLTDFIGTNALTPVYDAQVKALWDAGIFVATPVANDWLGDSKKGIPPKEPIGLPASSPYVFGTGGVLKNGTINPKTQRGPGLDLLGPSSGVSLPYYTPSKDEHIWTNGGEGNSWGTPHTLGTAVLIQQIDPTITPAQIMQILQDSGTPVVDPDGTGTYKSLNMLAAIQLAYQRRDDAADQGAGNDDLAHASRISLNGNRGSASNLKLLIHDHDDYTFTVSEAGHYRISTLDGVSLLDADGNVIGTTAAGGLSQDLAAGTYYLDVYNARRSLAGTYSISIVGPGAVGDPAAPGNAGTFNAIKYDQNDVLHFVWYEGSSKTLKYATRNPSKAWSSVTTIDGAADAGNFVSMDLDSVGRPGVAYYDASNADLKYAHFNGTSWDVETVDSTNTVGYYPSLKYDSSDHPVIAYYYKTGHDLRFASKSAGGWTITTVDSAGDVGRYPSLAANPASGVWSIAYEATGVGAFKYAQKKKGGWGIATVDDNGAGGGFVSLAYDESNLPSFSYYDAMNADLKFARSNGSVWSTATIAAKNSQGLYTNLFYDGGKPVIYFFNKTNNSLNAARSSGAHGWAFENLATGGGREDRVALNGDGFETFSWFDAGSGDLKVGDL